MKMVDMKSDPKDIPSQPVMSYSQSEYPYGLRIYLEEEQLAKLGIKGNLSVDTEMTLQATVEVVSVSMNEDQDKVCRCATLQIVEMSVSPAKDKKSADDLYDSTT